MIEELMKKPCWIIDILPERVPENSPGQFFRIEGWFLKDPALRKKQADFLLRLNCYYDLTVVDDEQEIKNPKPEELCARIGQEYLNILIGEGLITVDCTDSYMTLYSADEKLLELAQRLATAGGLFVWKG